MCHFEAHSINHVVRWGFTIDGVKMDAATVMLPVGDLF